MCILRNLNHLDGLKANQFDMPLNCYSLAVISLPGPEAQNLITFNDDMLHTTPEGQNIKYFNSVSVGTEFQNDNECEGYI